MGKASKIVYNFDKQQIEIEFEGSYWSGGSITYIPFETVLEWAERIKKNNVEEK